MQVRISKATGVLLKAYAKKHKRSASMEADALICIAIRNLKNQRRQERI
jgi:hypothetical protein